MRLLVVLVVACRASAPLPSATELGTTHECETSKVTAVDSPKREPPPPAAQRLLAVANELALVPADRARTHVAHAMSALADTLETLVPSAAEAIMQVRDSADALARDKQPRADVVRAGLDAATRAFYELQLQPGKHPRYQETIDALVLATAMIDRTAPLAEQYGDVRAAFHEAVRTVFAASNAPEPALTATAQR